MNRDTLRKIQNDMLEVKGTFLTYFIVLILSGVTTLESFPILTFIPEAIVTIYGLAYLIPIIILFKEERTTKQSRQLFIWLFLLICNIAVSFRDVID